MESFSEPRSLITAGIENIAYSKTVKLYLELHKERNYKIISSTELINRSPVNWSRWRQFNSLEKNPKVRKKVFDEFIEKTKYISPLVEERFTKIKRSFECSSVNLESSISSKIDPLSGYLEHENITCDQLEDFIKKLGNNAKKPFKEYLLDVSKKIFNKDPEYYDDFYFYRNKVYSNIENDFASVNPINIFKKTLNNLDFDLSRIHFDTEDRNNKYISPICFFVRIPEDIRVLYKNESPYFDFQACFHEAGHAVHASSINKDIDHWDKYYTPEGITGIFYIF
ncbi:MAG TPA: hypothetical protein VIY08_05480 [Candidatus Nitrosocosmicus sp.]